MTRVLLCTFCDGDTQVTIDGAALLLGITVEELRDVCPSLQAADLPDYLKRKAAKRGMAARDAMNTDNGNVCLAFWAVQTWNCTIDTDMTTGQMWAVMDDTQ